MCCFFFSSRRRHTRCSRDWSSDVCSSDLVADRRGGARCAAASEADGTSHTRTRIQWPAIAAAQDCAAERDRDRDRKSTPLNSSHGYISYAVFCLKKKKKLDRALRVSVTDVYTT